MYFALGFDSVSEPFVMPSYVSTPVGDSLVENRAHQSCVMTFPGCETLVDLFVLDMIDFDVILGMNWLAPYHVVLDCYAKTVTLASSGVPKIA